jgi:hypothetical protein
MMLFQRRISHNFLAFFFVFQQFVRGGKHGRVLSVSNPCILTLKEVQFLDSVASSLEEDSSIFLHSDANRTIVDTAQEQQDEEESSWYCELQGEDAEMLGYDFVSVDLDSSLLDDVVSGETTLLAPNAIVEGGAIKIPDSSEIELGMAVPVEGKESKDDYRNRRRLKTGQRTVLVVRVNAADASTEVDATTLYNEVFTGVGLTTQYDACSHGKLKFVPYQKNGYNGVTTVTISEKVAGVDNSVIRNAVVTKLGNVKDDVDHVMVCIPPGTSGSW